MRNLLFAIFILGGAAYYYFSPKEVGPFQVRFLYDSPELNNVRAYKQVSIYKTRKGLEVESSSGESGGIFFDLLFDENKRYLVKFKLGPKNIPANLRVTSAGKTYYRGTDHPLTQVEISQTKRAELLFYTEHDFHLLVENISVEELPAARLGVNSDEAKKLFQLPPHVQLTFSPSLSSELVSKANEKKAIHLEGYSTQPLFELTKELDPQKKYLFTLQADSHYPLQLVVQKGSLPEEWINSVEKGLQKYYVEGTNRVQFKLKTQGKISLDIVHLALSEIQSS